MIESVFKGNTYRYCKGKNGNYWVGASRSLSAGWGSSYFPGNNCTAPTSIWGELQSIAIASGTPREAFRSPKPEETKKSSPRKKKVSGPSISIF